MKRTNHAVVASLALALTACGVPQAPVAPTADAPALVGAGPDGQAYPDGNHYRLLAVEELTVVSVTADSSSSSGALQLAQPATIANVQVKTGPTPAGTSYAGLSSLRAIDGDLNTQLASGGR